MLSRIVLCWVGLYYTALCCVGLFCAVLDCVESCCPVLCCVVLCCVVLCWNVLCCDGLCCVGYVVPCCVVSCCVGAWQALLSIPQPFSHQVLACLHPPASISHSSTRGQSWLLAGVGARANCSPANPRCRDAPDVMQLAEQRFGEGSCFTLAGGRVGRCSSRT